MKLLIVEDEIKIIKPLKKALERYLYTVDYALNGKDGYQLAKINHYDCIILDLNLPIMDGLEVSRNLRKDNITTPILMLTARSEQENVIEGFECGADDYLRKPFHFQELLLRINSLIKRNNINKSEILTVADIQVDTKLKKVFKDGLLIKLHCKEYGILEYLLRNRGKLISQEDLLEHIWNDDIDCFTQTVRTNIKTLRQKVDLDKNIIETVKGSGYVIN